MATLSEYFRNEARDFLMTLERSLQRAPGPDAAELHRAVRGLRGTAQMAREQRIFDVVSAFESVTRSIADGALGWSDNVAARARDTIADLRVLLDRTEDDELLDARVSEAAARWREADPAPAPAPAAPVVDGGTADFREFAAREAAGIADTLDHGIQDLQTDPMDREPLTAILRRQRALLGSARLDEIPVLADILRAVEDLTRVIVKLDIGAKKEWLDIYRVARDALQTTIAPLLRDELPEGSHSVSRLRHMREELLERYGSAVEQPPPPEDSLAPPTLSHPAAPFLSSAPAARPHDAAPAPAAPPHDAARAPGAPPHDAGARPLGARPWQLAMPASSADAGSVLEDVAASELRHQPGSAISGQQGTAAGETAADDSQEADVRARRIPPAPDIAGPASHAPASHAAGSYAPASYARAHGHDAQVGAPFSDTAPADDDADVLELGEDSVVESDVSRIAAGEAGVIGDDAVMDLDEASVIENDAAAPDFDDRDEALLELDGGSVVDDDEGMLELGDYASVEESENVLELGEAEIEESGDLLEVVDAGLDQESGKLLEPGDASVEQESGELLELGDASVIDGGEDVLVLDGEGAIDNADPGALQQRVLELHDAVARATAHDPQARRALEELLTIIRRALG
ncbi:MAG TPA: hypothetical protein VK933_14150 [Longimicrobiales bacterium]|nr:hypothetical protein [Longimicrobiales bacterium]